MNKQCKKKQFVEIEFLGFKCENLCLNSKIVKVWDKIDKCYLYPLEKPMLY